MIFFFFFVSLVKTNRLEEACKKGGGILGILNREKEKVAEEATNFGPMYLLRVESLNPKMKT